MSANAVGQRAEAAWRVRIGLVIAGYRGEFANFIASVKPEQRIKSGVGGGESQRPIGRGLEKFNHWFVGLGQRYRRLIGWALNHRLVTMAIAAVVCALGGVLGFLTIRRSTPVRAVTRADMFSACEDPCVKVAQAS